MTDGVERARFQRQSFHRGLSAVVFGLVCAGAAALAVAESRGGALPSTASPGAGVWVLSAGILLFGLLRVLARHDWVPALCPYCGGNRVVRRHAVALRWTKTLLWAAPLAQLLVRLVAEGKARPGSWSGVALPAAGILGSVMVSLLGHRESLHCLACRSVRPEDGVASTQAPDVAIASTPASEDPGEDTGDPLVLRQIEHLAEMAERAYSDMYDSNANANYSDAKEFLYDAIGLASRSGFPRTAVRLESRLAHIKAVFRSQFS